MFMWLYGVGVARVGDAAIVFFCFCFAMPHSEKRPTKAAIYNYPASLVLRARDDDFSLLAFIVPTAPVSAAMMKKTAR